MQRVVVYSLNIIKFVFYSFLENVSLMLESCKYEKAWYIQSRPAWCAVFTQYDFEVRMQYTSDTIINYFTL